MDPTLTEFFESHGTGTSAGDSIEANAIHEVFAEYRTANDPIYIGATKSNIGHLEAASVFAVLIKTVLVLEKGIIPPNANFEKVSPLVPTKSGILRFPTSPTPWPTQGHRHTSVNSFGYGGNNSHAVLNDALSYLSDGGLNGVHCTAKSIDNFNSVSSYANSSTTSVEHRNGVTNQAGNEIPYVFVWSAFDEGGIDRWATAFITHHTPFSHNSASSSGLSL